MIDPRFSLTRVGDQYSDCFGKRFATQQEASDSFNEGVAFRESTAGRSLSRAELLQGVSRPKTDPRQQLADSQRRKGELAGPPAVQPTAVELHLQSVEKQRETAMPRWDRELIDAQRKVAQERSAQVAKEALNQLLTTAKATKVLTNLDKLILLAKYDATVPESVVNELAHQKSMLLKYGDVSATSANVQAIQSQHFENAKAASDQAQSHADRASQRRDALLADRSDWDSPPVVRQDILGSKTVELRFGGDSVSIPFDSFSGRTTPELLAQHFNVNAE